jgi:hypothetical protein
MIERQVAVIEIIQDAIADAASKGDLSRVVALIDALEQLVRTWGLMQQGLPSADVRGVERERVPASVGEKRVQRIPQQHQQVRSIPPQATQYVYGDGFRGVTLPTPEQGADGYRREYVELPEDRNGYSGRNGKDMEYWEDERGN